MKEKDGEIKNPLDSRGKNVADCHLREMKERNMKELTKDEVDLNIKLFDLLIEKNKMVYEKKRDTEEYRKIVERIQHLRKLLTARDVRRIEKYK